MPKNRRKHPTFLVCSHCGCLTGAPDYSQHDTLMGGSQSDIIKNALKRLEMYPKERKDGKNSKIQQSKR